MDWLLFSAIFFVTWWLCFFITLPFGVRTQQDEGLVIVGTAESAPVRPMLIRKALIATILAACVVGAMYFVNFQFGISLESLSGPVLQ